MSYSRHLSISIKNNLKKYDTSDSTFSFVIFPNSEQLTLIKCYKQLPQKSYWLFGSANAIAHIAVINFEDELSLQLHLDRIREFCKTVALQKLTLNA